MIRDRTRTQGDSGPLRRMSGAGGYWFEWEEGHSLDGEYAGLFSEVFAVQNDPLADVTKPFMGRLAPPVPPMRYARHYYNPDDPEGKQVVEGILNSANRSSSATLSRQQALIASKNELRDRVGYLGEIIDRLLSGLQAVLKAWLFKEVKACEGETNPRWSVEGIDRNVRDVWLSYALEGGSVEWYGGSKPYARAPAPVGEWVNVGLGHYHELLTLYWRQAAYLDLKRHTLDLCLHALLMDKSLPSWEDAQLPPGDPLYAIGKALCDEKRKPDEPFVRITYFYEWAGGIINLSGARAGQIIREADLYETGTSGKVKPEEVLRLQEELVKYYKERVKRNGASDSTSL